MKIKSGGDLLYNFYRERADAFIVNLYKASLDLSIDEIHNVRVEVKKIRSFFRTLRTIHLSSPDLKVIEGSREIFKDIFSLTGIIRETQLNLIEMSKLQISNADFNRYQKFIRETENKAVKDFKMLMKNFEINRFAEVNREVKRICENLNYTDIKKYYLDFICMEIKRVRKLTGSVPDNEQLHKIRKYLKSIHTALEYLMLIDRKIKIKKFIKRVKKTEVLLGQWHDKIVFISFLKRYLEAHKNESESKTAVFRNILERLNSSAEFSKPELYSEIRGVIKNIKI